MPFEHEITVRFFEVDRAGIAFFGRVFEYCHVAFEEMLIAAGEGLASVFHAGNWGMPLVHTEADFRRPMRMNERLTVTLEVERLGRTSVTFGFVVRGSADGETRATARFVHAFVDMKTFQKREVPDTLRAGLERLGLLADEGDDRAA